MSMPVTILRDRMLHLNSRIHLHEVEFLVFIDQKFQSSDVGISDVLIARTTRLPISSRKFRRHDDRRRTLQSAF